jgi:hypothetical protein
MLPFVWPSRFGLPSAPNFGQITSVASTRTGQIGLRLTF